MNLDAVVIGGGPSGAAAAIGLVRQGRSVAILEKSSFPRRKVCGEFVSAASLDLLEGLGVGDSIEARAGPEIRRLALHAAGPPVEAGMPRAAGRAYGRALGRHLLDQLLLDRARTLGALVLQPARATRLRRSRGLSIVELEDGRQVMAPVVIAAHGSWETGELPSQIRAPHRGSDLLAFKARFRGASLDTDLMPLLAFPGGYGGMVWSDGQCLSLSCCVRRDRLAAIRARHRRASAGESVLAHILASCPGAAEALDGARREDDWLGAGPIRPGIRPRFGGGILRVGNAAGESHPIIAEGISMALQSGWLLADELGREPAWDASAIARASRRYAERWRRQFALRIAIAGMLYQLASRPLGAELMRQVVGLAPPLLSLGARLSGKSAPLPN